MKKKNDDNDIDQSILREILYKLYDNMENKA